MSLVSLAAVLGIVLAGQTVLVIYVLITIIRIQIRSLNKSNATLHGLFTELQINKAYAEGGKEAAQNAVIASRLGGIASATANQEAKPKTVTERQEPEKPKEQFIIEHGIK